MPKQKLLNVVGEALFHQSVYITKRMQSGVSIATVNKAREVFEDALQNMYHTIELLTADDFPESPYDVAVYIEFARGVTGKIDIDVFDMVNDHQVDQVTVADMDEALGWAKARGLSTRPVAGV